MGYKLIACNMDETLLNDNHEICERNIKAIRKAKEEYGVKFVPTTGRSYGQIQDSLKVIGLHDENNEYILSFNGGALTENKNNRLIDFRGLDFSKMKELFEFGLIKDVCMHVYTKDTVYVYRISESENERIKNQKVQCVIMEEDTVDFLKDTEIAKILYQNVDVTYMQGFEKDMEYITKDCCSVSYSSNRYMEFNALGVDKGQALIRLARILGIDIEDTIAVGDNYNDMAMLKVAGLSVAAGNAVEDVKEACDLTTKATNNDGVVAELLERFVFNKYKDTIKLS